jgi:hypothetical protein
LGHSATADQAKVRAIWQLLLFAFYPASVVFGKPLIVYVRRTSLHHHVRQSFWDTTAVALQCTAILRDLRL